MAVCFFHLQRTNPLCFYFGKQCYIPGVLSAYLEFRPRKRKIYTVDPYSSLTCRFYIFSKSCCVKPRHKVGDKRLIVKKPEDPGAFWRSCTTIFLLIQVGNICDAKDISVHSFRNLLLRWLEEVLKKKSNSWKIILAKWCCTAPTPALQVQVHQRRNGYGRT